MPDDGRVILNQEKIRDLMMNNKRIKPLAPDPPDVPEIDGKAIEAINRLPVGTSFDEKTLLYIIDDINGASSLHRLRANPDVYGIRIFTCLITGAYRYTRKDN